MPVIQTITAQPLQAAPVCQASTITLPASTVVNTVSAAPVTETTTITTTSTVSAAPVVQTMNIVSTYISPSPYAVHVEKTSYITCTKTVMKTCTKYLTVTQPYIVYQQPTPQAANSPYQKKATSNEYEDDDHY